MARQGCLCDGVWFQSGGSAVAEFSRDHDCAHCFSFLTNAVVNRVRGGDGKLLPVVPAPTGVERPRHVAPSTPQPPPEPCDYRGDPVRGPAAPDVVRDWHFCDHPRRVELGLAAVTCPCTGCKPGCPGYYSGGIGTSGVRPNALPPSSRVTVGGLPGHFNAGLCEFRGRTYLASRTPAGRVCLSELDGDLRPVWSTILKPDAPGGHEDPRLFVRGGRLRVGFTSATGGGPGGWRCRQCVAELGEDFAVVRTDVLGYGGPQEKNWGWFEGPDGEQLAVYSIAPRHVVVRIDGNRVEVVADTPNPLPWSGGHARGGAPPVRVGDRYVSFFHGALQTGRNQRRTYSVGVYEFEAAPPYRVIGMHPDPLLWATAADEQPRVRGMRVIFPSGAVRRGGSWLVSMGVADQYVQVCRWDESAVGGLLGPRWRAGTYDERIWRSVADADEYGLSGFDPSGGAVLDVGAHVGSFASAALARGAAVVHCYEPEPGNVALLRLNAPRAAVFPEAVGFGPLHLKESPTEGNTGGWWCVPEPVGPAVEVTRPDAAVARCVAASPDRRVRLVKLDCEGGEWDFLRHCTLLDRIDALVGEWHPPGGPDGLRSLLGPHGFAVDCRPSMDGRGIFRATRTG